MNANDNECNDVQTQMNANDVQTRMNAIMYKHE